ncbi:ATP-dependent RNA helicase, partial [Arthrobacter deserti]|nr:ATP-dependent RNA helicase [Arthrobacter deserti]
PREKYLLRAIEKTTRQPVELMHLPTVDTVNANRLEKFAGRITETLESEDLAVFRELVEKYEAEHDVTAVEIAAALAHMAQGGRPLLMEELPVPPAKQARLAGAKRDAFGPRGPSRTLTEGNATSRIAVGRRNRVMPGSVVGAIANEGGLNAAQIGGIDIRSDHSLVELPADLSQEQLRALSKTRIGGELINLELDSGRKPRRDREEGGYRGDRGGFRGGDRGGFRSDRGERDRGYRSDRGERPFKKKPEGERDRGYRYESNFGGHGMGARKPRHGRG